MSDQETNSADRRGGGGILIVDDNEVNREICALNLEDLNIALHFAENGVEGLALARQKLPDLILLDIMMPEMDGFTMLEHLKHDDRLASIPVLMLTAKGETASVVQALELGANDYLKKPFAEAELIARANTLLRNRVLERRVAEDLAAGAAMQRKFLTDGDRLKTYGADCGLAVTIYNRPYGTISGDFYFSTAHPDRQLHFFLGDSCGHGLSAALLSMRIIGLLQQAGRDRIMPAELLNSINQDLSDLLPYGRFVAATSLLFRDDKVIFSNCGQPYPVLISSAFGIAEIVQNNIPLGLHDHTVFGQDEFEFTVGDKLLLYTDGIIEAADTTRNIFGRKRLYGCLKKVGTKGGGSDLCNEIIEALDTFNRQQFPEDDQTMIVFEKMK